MINPLFTKPFNEETFTSFVEGFIPSIIISKKLANPRSGFKSIQQIAEATESDLDLVVFIAKLDSSLNARVEITKNTYAVLKNHARSNAIVAYISEDSMEWRFSLITTKVTRTSEGVRETISNPRRFSYLLGPSAKVLTPSNMLSGVIKTTKDLENKFSLAVVSKEFYTRIAVQYSKLVGGTRGVGRRAETYERTLKLGISDDTVNANFAIRLIGRLVFCWFLKQKKDGSNIPLIPNELLSVDAVSKTQDYYHSICAPLFFEVLNKQQSSRPTLFTHSELFNKVPFLNGGLFQDHVEDNHKFNRTSGLSERRGVVDVPNAWIEELFEIFEEYNFTIDENTSIDTELSIDPEMLGRIFENLLAEVNPETGASARKATGSFYTPREIVDFMVEESLVAHLKTKTGIADDKIRTLTSYDLEDDANFLFTKDEKKMLVDAIHDTAVLDPACGSGAFPIGMLQRMVHILGVLDPDCSIYLNKFPAEARRQLLHHNLTYVRKLGIIRECIHGVDIQPIAVDISRLRCFLTLVVDQQVDDSAPNRGIDPLPNLDFKFVCANTLISPPVHGGPLFGDEFAIALGELIDEYFAPVDQNHKLVTAGKLKDLIHEKTKTELENILKSYSYIKDEKYKKLLVQNDEKKNAERMRINNLWGSYENIFQNKPVGFFDTRYFFPTVHKKGGFDIVIGNPPYVGEKGHKEIFQPIAKSPLGERFYLGKMDLFYFFFHVGLDVLHEGGVLAFITTNYYITATGARKLRDDFKNRSTILELINFNELKIFKSALGQHNIVTVLKKGNFQKEASTASTKRTGDATSEILNEIIGWQDVQTDYFNISQTELYDGNEFYIRLTGNSATSKDQTQKILDNIKKQGEPLGISCNINCGIQTGCNEITINNKKYGLFVLSNEEKENALFKHEAKDLIKPFFNTSDIYKYGTLENSKYWIIYSDVSFQDIEKMPNLKTHFNKKEAREILDNVREVKSGRRKYFQLQWPRNKSIFLNEKIVCPQRSIDNKFGYNNGEWFGGSGMFFITLKTSVEFKLKYILALLNSRLYYQWLYYKGKRKGESLELIATPLSEIPIKKISVFEQEPFIKLVDQILTLKKQNNDADTKNLEAQIDQLVYELYDLGPDEIKIVENSIKK